MRIHNTSREHAIGRPFIYHCIKSFWSVAWNCAMKNIHTSSQAIELLVDLSLTLHSVLHFPLKVENPSKTNAFRSWNMEVTRCKTGLPCGRYDRQMCSGDNAKLAAKNRCLGIFVGESITSRTFQRRTLCVCSGINVWTGERRLAWEIYGIRYSLCRNWWFVECGTVCTEQMLLPTRTTTRIP